MATRLSPKAHILFVHVTTKAEIFLATEKMKSRNQDGFRFTDWWLAQAHVSQPYLHRSKLVKSASYILKQTNNLVYYPVLNIIATAVAPSLRMFFPSVIYLCLCLVKVIDVVLKCMFFYYRYKSTFVFFQASVCSLLTPGILESIAFYVVVKAL